MAQKQRETRQMIDQSSNKKGVYLVLSESIESWQAAEFIIKFTLESEKKKVLSSLLYAVERLSDHKHMGNISSVTHIYTTPPFLPLWSKRSLGRNDRHNKLYMIKHAGCDNSDVKISVSSHVF